jgi:hypothetical protein
MNPDGVGTVDGARRGCLSLLRAREDQPRSDSPSLTLEECIMANNTTWSHEPFRASSYLTFPPHAANRVAVTPALYAKHVLPVHACYYAAAVLVQMPRTRVFRVALLPVTLCLAWIAGVAFDLSGGDPKYDFLSFGQCVSLS